MHCIDNILLQGFPYSSSWFNLGVFKSLCFYLFLSSFVNLVVPILEGTVSLAAKTCVFCKSWQTLPFLLLNVPMNMGNF